VDFIEAHGDVGSSWRFCCFCSKESIADYLNLPGSNLIALLAVALHSTFRWDAGEAIFRASTDFVVLPPILLLKELFGSVDRCS
jgi:phosphotransferase system  glucose/maltose/N-acetylglucosamine-specific IIC component